MRYITLNCENGTTPTQLSIAIDNIALFVRYKGDDVTTLFFKEAQSDVIGQEVVETVEDIVKALSAKQIITAQFNTAAHENFEQIGLAIDNIASFEKRINDDTTRIYPKNALYRMNGFDVNGSVKDVERKVKYPKNTIS